MTIRYRLLVYALPPGVWVHFQACVRCVDGIFRLATVGRVNRRRGLQELFVVDCGFGQSVPVETLGPTMPLVIMPSSPTPNTHHHAPA
jgi:hypothetical protein